MKKYLFFLLFAAFGATTLAGQNAPVIPVENAQWKELYITIAGPQTRFTVICGDTLIGQQTWSKVHLVSTDTNLQVVWSIYQGALRSDETKAWFIPAETTDTILLYDFTLEAGDTFELVQPWSTWVDKIVVDFTEELLIGGKLRKVIHFEPIPWAYEDEFWMGGIGSNRGLLNRGTGQGPDYGTYLACFRHNDELINFSQQPCLFPDLPECPFSGVGESDKPAISIYVNPNPANTEAVISVSESGVPDWEVKIFNVDGKLIHREETTLPLSLRVDEWPAGVYLLSVKSTGNNSIQSSRLFVVQH